MKKNWELLGHEWAVHLLKKQVAAGNFRHAYLFTGPDGVGRRTLALRLAQALNCTNPPTAGEVCGSCRSCRGFSRGQHADLLIVELQEGDREIKIDALRELSRSLSRTPLEAKYQIALLPDFQLASEEAANALLKTLEEPNPSVVLCLIAPDADSLPETIVSRCEVIRLRPMATEELFTALSQTLAIPDQKGKLFASLSNGCPGLALHWNEHPEHLEQRLQWLEDGVQLLYANRVQRFAFAEKASKDRSGLRDLLLAWLSLWRDIVLRTSHSKTPISNVNHEETLQKLSGELTPAAAQAAFLATEQSLTQLGTNVNARLALENLLLGFPSL